MSDSPPPAWYEPPDDDECGNEWTVRYPLPPPEGLVRPNGNYEKEGGSQCQST